jgi:hypothetical protein
MGHPDFDDSYSALYDDDGVHLFFIGMTYLPPFIQECISNVNIEEYFRGGN